jgi:hypothetical protein
MAMSDKSKKFEAASDLELMQLFTDLTNLSGQKFSSEEDVNICYMNFIPLFKNSFGKYTLEEIRLAYQYAREGKFSNEKGEQFKMYRELNYASACDVMLEYEEFKKNKLGPFVQNQTLFLAESSKESVSIIDAIEEFLIESWAITSRNEVDKVRGSFLYDYFKDLGLINLSKEEKTEIWELALEMVKSEKEIEKSNTADYNLYKQLESALKKISENSTDVVIYSKRIAFGYQIRNWQMEGLVIENIKKHLIEHETKI